MFDVTDADAPSVVEHGTVGALALVAADDVDAVPVGAGIDAELFALVDVFANVCGRVELRSSRTDALRRNCGNDCWVLMR